MKSLLLVVVLIIVVSLVALRYYGGPQGPELSEVTYLMKPRINERPPVKVMLLELKGNPAQTSKVASQLLYKTYGEIPGSSKGTNMPALLARWSRTSSSNPDQCLGRFALPVPSGVIGLPQISDTPKLKLSLTDWGADTVAEILHVGPYSTEAKTMDQLRGFVRESGYEIGEDQEEEYLRGPGPIFGGDPETYLTIIRFPVRQKLALAK